MSSTIDSPRVKDGADIPGASLSRLHGGMTNTSCHAATIGLSYMVSVLKTNGFRVMTAISGCLSDSRVVIGAVA